MLKTSFSHCNMYVFSCLLEKQWTSHSLLFKLYFLITLLLFNYSCLHYPPPLPPNPSQSYSHPCFHPPPWFGPCVLYGCSWKPFPHCPLHVWNIGVTFLLRWNSHNIRVTISKHTIQGAFSTFTMLCNHHHYLITEHFYHISPLKKNLRPIKQSFLIHPFFQPWWWLICLLWMDLPILNTSYKWNHIICGLLCLAPFT